MRFCHFKFHIPDESLGQPSIRHVFCNLSMFLVERAALVQAVKFQVIALVL